MIFKVALEMIIFIIFCKKNWDFGLVVEITTKVVRNIEIQFLSYYVTSFQSFKEDSHLLINCYNCVVHNSFEMK